MKKTKISLDKKMGIIMASLYALPIIWILNALFNNYSIIKEREILENIPEYNNARKMINSLREEEWKYLALVEEIKKYEDGKLGYYVGDRVNLRKGVLYAVEPNFRLLSELPKIKSIDSILSAEKTKAEQKSSELKKEIAIVKKELDEMSEKDAEIAIHQKNIDFYINRAFNPFYYKK